ncbi:MarR family winged helix-turn-helix transcriptional regulator [uncultured Alsobacter sp.]|uniref:MarR family winged helix-turn-helix transcriptional regulator n=1 Tax=uncultured Alsobacter sp. TaxID=1748258 RepID=UPI0025F6D566|nr:MarR family transcriptional regulator [uncultured Alsobacter sp.]
MAETSTRSKRKAVPAPVEPTPEPVAPRDVDVGRLKERFGYVLRRAQIAVFQDFFASFAEHDIRPAQYSTLTIIEANPGLSQTQVADALGIQKTNFVAMIGALEKRGLVRREPSPTDRRTYRLFLTPKGAALVGELHGVAEAHDRRIAELVGEKTFDGLFAPLRAVADGLKRPPEG